MPQVHHERNTFNIHILESTFPQLQRVIEVIRKEGHAGVLAQVIARAGQSFTLQEEEITVAEDSIGVTVTFPNQSAKDAFSHSWTSTILTDD